MSPQPGQWVCLCSDELEAQIDPVGAQLSTLRDRAGRDLLWNGDASVWAGRAPILFPIVGRLAGGHYRLGSSVYALARHGFARGRRFELLDSTAASAVFRLQADAASLALYPFEFELQVQFALDGATLSVISRVRNHGDSAMPASFGYHPAFRWPLPYGHERQTHYIEFATDEPAPVRRLGPDGLLSPQSHPTPVLQRRLALCDALFTDDALIFDQVRSRQVSYGAEAGPRLRVEFPDTPLLGLWSKPQANFVCIEPWHGIADPAGFSGDFRSKPGIFMVAAGGELPISMAITLLGL